jgi:antitoxin (DNA-binding transcriptional repressor) of toxin-antitoxin stability system
MARPLLSIDVSDIEGPMARAVRHVRRGQVVHIIERGNVVARVVPATSLALSEEEEEALWAPHLDLLNAEARDCVED